MEFLRISPESFRVHKHVYIDNESFFLDIIPNSTKK